MAVNVQVLGNPDAELTYVERSVAREAVDQQKIELLRRRRSRSVQAKSILECFFLLLGKCTHTQNSRENYVMDADQPNSGI